MSRGHFERVREIVGTDDLLAGTITVARLDVAAQNHAAAEGHADPYPAPAAEQGTRTRADGRARATPQSTPPGGCHTPTVSRGESHGSAGTTRVIRESAAYDGTGGSCRE